MKLCLETKTAAEKNIRKIALEHAQSCKEIYQKIDESKDLALEVR